MSTGTEANCNTNRREPIVPRVLTLEESEVEWVPELYPQKAALKIHDDIDDTPIPPREWLLGTTFCRRFPSAVYSAGGGAKTSLRIAQGVAVTSGKEITGERVFVRCRVLILCLEDDVNEVKRRIKACLIHHKIPYPKGWLFFAAPGKAAGKLMVVGENGREVSSLNDYIVDAIKQHNLDIVITDPLKKAHGLDENDNTAMDEVIQLIADIGIQYNVAMDFTHHTSKGVADAGNADRGRGASAVKDGARLVKTSTGMSPEEARMFGIGEEDRRFLFRYDGAKENTTPPTEAKWFRLVSVPLDNGTELYPAGDHVQTVEVWAPPDAWQGMNSLASNEILTAIDAGMPDGNRYSDAPKADDRAAWKLVKQRMPDKGDAECRAIIRAWVKSGLLYPVEYENPSTRKPVKGLRVDATKRPT